MSECFDMKLRLLTVEDIAMLLNIKISKVRSLIFKREIPYIKIGNLVRFNLEAVIKWIDTNSIQTVGKI